MYLTNPLFLFYMYAIYDDVSWLKSKYNILWKWTKLHWFIAICTVFIDAIMNLHSINKLKAATQTDIIFIPVMYKHIFMST